MPKDLEARLVYNEDPTHFALGIYDGKNQGLCILDSWGQKAGLAPKLYDGASFDEARSKWGADAKSTMRVFDAALAEFMARNPFAEGDSARIFFAEDYLPSLDYALYHYFASPDATQRKNIAPGFLKSIKQQLTHALPKDKEGVQRAENLDQLQPYLKEYFERFYGLSIPEQRR